MIYTGTSLRFGYARVGIAKSTLHVMLQREGSNAIIEFVKGTYMRVFKLYRGVLHLASLIGRALDVQVNLFHKLVFC